MDIEQKPIKSDARRNPDGTFGVGNNANPLGRPKGKTLKEYQAEKFRQMTDEEKEQWLKDNKISGDLQWRMGEGNPAQDLTSKGEKIEQIPIYGGQSIPKYDSNKENIQPDQENQSS